VIVVWSDYVSPYAFVAKAGAYALEADYEVELQWRPYTLDVASFMGPVEERDPHHWRRVRYSYMDARRFANRQGLVLKGPKKVYYARSANAGMLYAQRHGVFRRYNDLAFDRFWRRANSIRKMSMPWPRCWVKPARRRASPRSWQARAAPSTTSSATKPRPRASLVCRPSFSTASCSGAATGSACCASGWTRRV
jgi:DSBA-like thioredoxin domain